MATIDETEWLGMMASPKVRVVDEAPRFDLWSYFGSIPPSDFGGHDFADGIVDYVWRAADGSWEHVLVRSNTPNVFMVLVLDNSDHAVRGHRLLDLNAHFGVTPHSA